MEAILRCQLKDAAVGFFHADNQPLGSERLRGLCWASFFNMSNWPPDYGGISEHGRPGS